MGCLCCKPSVIEDSRESPAEVPASKTPMGSRGASMRREEMFRKQDRNDDGDRRTVLIDKSANLRLHAEHMEKKKTEYSISRHLGIGGVPKAMEGEQVAAGWPAWLAAVAGEAIKGWVPRRADSFEKLDKHLSSRGSHRPQPPCLLGKKHGLLPSNPPRTLLIIYYERDILRKIMMNLSYHTEDYYGFPLKIGQGTYSNVYRARDLEKRKVVALKKVRFDNLEPESVRFMAREIHVLRRLDHPNIIKLEGLVTSRMSCSLYLVFEYMEHDLAGLASHPAIKFTESQVKCYMKQLLSGLDHCHSHGILHRDIKGSNLLIDNNGILKIADFGLATFYDPRQTQPLTSRVVTLWYRPPELLLGATNYGTAVDLWSAGCILAELYAGKPIMPGRTEVEQLHKIFKLCGSPSEDYWKKSRLPHATIFKPQQPYKRVVMETFKDFPLPALNLMETLLSIDPVERGSAASALQSEFFIVKPLPCDPSSLPKYPPSKEFDAKLRDEEARRQGASASKAHRADNERKVARESRAVPAPDANAELMTSMQKRQSQPNSKSRSEMFNPQQEEVASGFPIEPPRPSRGMEQVRNAPGYNRKKVSHSGPLEAGWAKTGRNTDDAPKLSTGEDLSLMSTLLAARKNQNNLDDKASLPQNAAPKLIARFPGSFKEVSGSKAGQDQQHLSLGDASTHQNDIGRVSNNDPIVLGYGSKGKKIHFSGPLLAPSRNTDQMMKDHDRQIQEAVRRSRIANMRKIPIEENKAVTASSSVSGR